MNYINCSENILDVSEINDLVSQNEGTATFLYVETNKLDRQNIDIELDKQLEKYFHQICADVRSKWINIMHIAIHKRLGIINHNEIAMVIAISSSFLSDSIDAIQFIVSKVKSFKSITYDKDCSPNIDEINSETSEPINYDLIEIDDIPTDLIQIKANNYEIRKRIENFILMKRTALNERNIKEFVEVPAATDLEHISDYSQCARVDAILWKRADSKSHLKIHKVYNEWGPQTGKVINDAKGSCPEKSVTDIPRAIDERVTNCERHIGIERPISTDIYNRLKHIENRILELDSLSPEYASFWTNNCHEQNESKNSNKDAHKTHTKRKYTLEDLNDKLVKIKRKIQYNSN